MNKLESTYNISLHELKIRSEKNKMHKQFSAFPISKDREEYICLIAKKELLTENNTKLKDDLNNPKDKDSENILLFGKVNQDQVLCNEHKFSLSDYGIQKFISLIKTKRFMGEEYSTGMWSPQIDKATQSENNYYNIGLSFRDETFKKIWLNVESDDKRLLVPMEESDLKRLESKIEQYSQTHLANRF